MSRGRGILLIAATLAVIAVIVGFLFFSSPGSDTTQVSPVQLTPDIVAKGEYLVVAGNCVTCHTGPDGIAFAGGHPFFTDFGTIYSTNITPDNENGIGNWTESQFRRAMREGVDADGRHLYPVFPFQYYARLSDADITAIFAFLRTINPVSKAPPESEMKFPFGWRRLLGIWKKIYLNSEQMVPDPGQSASWNRGAYLAEALGHCGACHTPRNALGAERQELSYTGATYMDEVTEDLVRPWSSVNLTSASTGLGPWSADELFLYLKTGHSKIAGTFGPMNNVIVNSTSQFTDEDLDALVTYFKSLPPNDRNTINDVSAEELRVGEHVYSIHCATCHLPTGLTNEKGPAVAGSAVVQAPEPATLINVILYGAWVPEPKPDGAWESMEGFELELDDEEVAALANYMRTSWGNAAGKVTVKQVEAQR